MIDSCAVQAGPAGEIGVMVQTPRSVYVYWRLATRAPGPLAVRITDLSGRPPHHGLDGRGQRLVDVPPGAGGIYLDQLIPGRPYAVEVGVREGDGLRPLLAAPPVEPPRLPAAGYVPPAFPHPYSRS